MGAQDLQTIEARGSVIKIINTSGTQVIDTWAFALPKPEPKPSGGGGEEQEQKKEEQKGQQAKKLSPTQVKKSGELPSQEDAEKATQEAQAKGDEATDETQKKTWTSYATSYVPTLGLGGKKGDDKGDGGKKGETEQQKNSRTWSSYFAVGQGFSSYIPKQATDTVSQFASQHQRDTSKSYLEQLQDFSKTPVGAAGMAAVTGSGYGGSLYAGYNAWNAKNAADAASMEFMSMTHTRAATLHLSPKVNDTLVSNVREPILTVVEDSSPGVHDTLIAACDPKRYKNLGVPKWEEHGSCAENLVLALKELNERAGLKGAKAVGADVTINNVPAPLNLFMNIPWDDEGDLGFKAPKSKKGDFIRLRAERDVVVVMSACPQDILDINNKNPTDASFVVEESEDAAKAVKRTAPKKKVPARRPSAAPSQAGSTASAQPKKKPIPSKTPPAKKPANAVQSGGTPAQPAQKAAQPAKKAPAPVKKAAPAQPAKAPAAPPKKPTPPTANGTPNGGAAPVKKAPKKLAKPQAAAE
ncbi:hypothetical protein M409DRAFT_63381 [Zasmidium cellare ATCC 36951]|uniref:DUF1989 domain-containing protein n=1 Tax=Zasmidium cellare ATCC 36951 TaxID=1080233 RepID=A0A6A6D080_ZASCE|nr:uncharacterized protein M409DRAFT_63381 [Zasmidium cellare ATCC 36951]KAF2171818.1 hypothetical protein M409DRAFT_63381 [Zasmidium cellare ATCC 36951]